MIGQSWKWFIKENFESTKLKIKVIKNSVENRSSPISNPGVVFMNDFSYVTTLNNGAR